MLLAEYTLIAHYYGSQKAKRSGVHLIKHIDEGLLVLEKINATHIARKAYCLHPLVQSDADLLANQHLLDNIDQPVIIALMEYRAVANAYLSTRTINAISEIKLSPLQAVNEMLIADKIQNKKDFELYHKGKHARSAALSAYFDNWLERLGISHALYSEIIHFIQANSRD